MKRTVASLLLTGALWALSLAPALAQNPQTVKLCVPTSNTACANVTASAPLPVTGSFSATLSGFTPNGNYTTLTATAASSASTALPAGTVVAFQNLSAIDVSCVLTAGASTATTNKIIVRGGATVFLTIGSNTTTACINQTGSASNVVGLAGGSGLGTNFGGGGGGGGGGAITIASGAVASGAYASGSIASGAMVDLGAQADAAAAGDTSTASLIALLKRNNQNLTTLNTTASSPASLAVNVTPTDCSLALTTGATAQNAFSAGATKHGFTIANLDTTEVAWISFTGTAVAGAIASYPLAPATATTFAGLSSYTTPPGFGMNTALSVIAATTGHKFSCTWW